MTEKAPRSYSLLELAQGVERMFQQHWTQYYWVRAEINKLNIYKHSGHAYLELVEKQHEKVVVELRGMIWNSELPRIQQQFREAVREELKDGIKILCYARLRYTPRHGISLEIKDIDPSFSMGDLEREKKACMDELQKKGLFHRNASLSLPLLPQRLAIISVESSKGYQDFLHLLQAADNQYGFKFFHLLFPALLQGDKAVQDISRQLQRIGQVAHHFDAILIIRGGGGDIGLSCYNHLQLCTAIANSPLPVLTGIGHTTNQTVAEMVAHTSAITPSHLAEQLLGSFHHFSDQLQTIKRTLHEEPPFILQAGKQHFEQLTSLFHWKVQDTLRLHQGKLQEESHSLSKAAFLLQSKANQQMTKQLWKFIPSTQWRLRESGNNLDALQQMLPHFAKKLLKDCTEELQQQVEMVQAYDPQRVLERGYSITSINGRAVRNSQELKEGDILLTQFAQGSTSSVVKKNNQTDE